MKKIIFTTLSLLLTFGLTAQTTLFSEDFETSPVSSILNEWNSETQLTEGPSPCSSASRGNSTDFNSTNVDFNSAQNGSYYLGVNPEAPCGGFYNASLITSTQDFSGSYDSLVFSARYFMSTTLNWGAAQLEVVFDNGSDTDTIRDEFVTTDNWDAVTYKLPASMIAASVDITINMGGGEGVALDDITIDAYAPGASINESALSFSVYPNPANNMINVLTAALDANWALYSISGKQLITGDIRNTSTKIDVSDLDAGIYFIELTSNKASRTEKIIIH